MDLKGQRSFKDFHAYCLVSEFTIPRVGTSLDVLFIKQ